MILASKLSGYSPEHLEALYREACEDDSNFRVSTEDFFEVEDGDEVPLPETTCMDLLDQLRSDATAAGDGLEEGGTQTEAANDTDVFEQIPIPDSDNIEKLLNLENVIEPFKAETSKSPRSNGDSDHLPVTLREAIKQPDLWNGLFRFCVRLRSTKGGMDTRFLSNARAARKAAKNLNWYQPLGLNISAHAHACKCVQL